MAIALITTPSGSNSNAYVNVAEANAYLLDGRLQASAWEDLDDDDKARAIIWATFLIDNLWTWMGSPTLTTQALVWPRYGAWTRDGTSLDSSVVPPVVRRATAELAFYLTQKDRTADPKLLGLGFRSASVGSLSVTVDPTMIPELVPLYIKAILAPYGTYDQTSEANPGGKVVKLKRS